MKVLVLAVILLFVSEITSQTTFKLEEHFGVQHDWQPVEFPYNGTSAGMIMIGPTGQEVPFQKLNTNMILIRSRLPASAVSRTWLPPFLDPGVDAWSCTSALCPRNGDVAQLRIVSQTGTLPANLPPSTNFFMGQTSAGWQFYTSKSRTTPINWTTYTTGNIMIVSNGWIVDPDDATFDTLYVNQHSFQTSDPVTIRCIYESKLPNPLVCNSTYFVISTGPNNLQLASSYSNAMNGIAIDITESSSGITTVSELFVSWTWSLQSGTPTSTPSNAVTMLDSTNYWELKNGLTGVRILKPQANTNKNKVSINAILLNDGTTWLAQDTVFTGNTSAITGVYATILEQGPLKTTIQTTYTTDRSMYYYGAWWNIVEVNTVDDTIAVTGNMYWKSGTSITFRGNSLPCPLQLNKLYWPSSWKYDPYKGVTYFTLTDVRGGRTLDLNCTGSGSQVLEAQTLAGPGSFNQTVTLYAGHKTIMIEDDMDTKLIYYLDFYKTGVFEPNLIRYRGHSASSMACGYQFAADGVTKVTGASYTSDSLVDLQYTTARMPSYNCGSSTFCGAINWYPASSGVDGGWYYMMYKNGTADTYPMIGMFTGRSSRSIGLIVKTPSPWTNTGPNAGFGLYTDFRGPDGSSTQRVRREWALYVSTNAEVPTNMTIIPPVALERNRISGINLNRLAAYSMSFPDPVGGWSAYKGWEDKWNKLISDIQTPDGIYYNWALTNMADIKDLVTFWRENNTWAVDWLFSNYQSQTHKFATILARELGNYDSWWQYYQPAWYIDWAITRMVAVFRSGLVTPIQKARWISHIAFYASVIWDEDYTGFSSDTREGTGTPNQRLMMVNMRADIAYNLPTMSTMKPLALNAVQGALADTMTYLDARGTPMGTTWYQEDSTEPGLDNLYNLKRESGVNMTTFYNAYIGMGKWYLNALTPIEPRFGTGRKMVSLGDGNTYSSGLSGIVAPALRDVDPVMASYLQWAWAVQGYRVSQFTLSDSLVVDRNATQTKPYLTSQYFPGYMSVFRHNFDTPQETAAWFINGDWYFDHKQYDTGQVSIYAHNAPLSVDWNPNLYNPRVNGGYQHNRAVTESSIPFTWSADNPSLTSAPYDIPTMASSFAAFTYSTTSQASFGNNPNDTWVRQVSMIVPNPKYPIIFVRDDFKGAYANTSRVLTWNFMATGAVKTPSGDYTPITRMYPSMPSNGTLVSLDVGLNKFQFTGQSWKAHPKGGIDWDYYYYSNGTAQYFIGNWGHNQENSAEMNEYKATNNATFTEIQHIFRLKTNVPMVSIIMPYEKGNTYSGVVTTTNCGISIGPEIQCLTENGYSYQNGSLQIYTTFGPDMSFTSPIKITGGAAELVLNSATQGTITISGAKGDRNFTLPSDTWYGPGLISLGNSLYQVKYSQDTPLTLAISTSSDPSPTPSASSSPSMASTPSPTASISVSPSRTPTPSRTPSNTPSSTPTPSVTPSSSGSPSTTPSQSGTPSGTPSPTSTPTPSPSPSATQSPSRTPSNASPSRIPSPSRTPTRTASPTNSPSQNSSPSRSPSRTPSRTPSSSPSKGYTPSPNRTPSSSPSKGYTPTPSRFAGVDDIVSSATELNVSWIAIAVGAAMWIQHH